MEPAPTATGPVVITVRDRGPLEMLRETWQLRRLAPRIGVRIIVKGFAGTRLGRSWLLLRPLISTFALAFLFGGVLNAPSSGVPYVLFLIVGMSCWTIFERWVYFATKSFDIYRKVAVNFDIPLLLLPLAAGVVAVVDMATMLVLGLLASLYFLVAEAHVYVHAGPGLMLAVAGYGLAGLLAMSISVWTSALNLKVRDVRILLRYVITIWLYVTPVMYAASALDGAWRFLATINPMVAPIELVKKGLLDVGTISPLSLTISLASVVLVGGTGLVFFSRNVANFMRDDQFGGLDDEDPM